MVVVDDVAEVVSGGGVVGNVRCARFDGGGALVVLLPTDWCVLRILLMDEIEGITKELCCCWRSRRNRSLISQAKRVGD